MPTTRRPAWLDGPRLLKAISERVVVYDGGMGATLEQFELTSEDYGGRPRSATRGRRPRRSSEPG
ncbi:MAG TPA: hypothetical protein VNY31_03800 [Solirubrobacteraceae bacterium]|nr:hypothetical protein [Solirubrobacteraceae bacterium]